MTNKTQDELIAALKLCEAVLHPGAVGLIMNEHGQQAGDRACTAVYAIRKALAMSAPQMDLTEAAETHTCPHCARVYEEALPASGGCFSDDCPGHEQATIMAIAERLRQHDKGSEDLDGLVHDTASNGASEANNSGFEAQVEFLVEAFGLPATLDLLQQELAIDFSDLKGA